METTQAKDYVFTFVGSLLRRWGVGIYRDAVKSSAKHTVKSSGVRWQVMQVLLYDFAPTSPPRRWRGRPRTKGSRQLSLQ